MFINFEPNFIEKSHRESVFFLLMLLLFCFLFFLFIYFFKFWWRDYFREKKSVLIAILKPRFMFFLLIYGYFSCIQIWCMLVSFRNSYGKVQKKKWRSLSGPPWEQIGVKSSLGTEVLMTLNELQNIFLRCLECQKDHCI